MRNTRDTKLLFELSEAGRRAHRLPACDVPERPVERIAAGRARWPTRRLPCRSCREPQVVRHFANLSQLNMSVDTHFYPLGSCTMKYNPKRNERVARMPGFADLHPYQPEETLQGMLQLLYEMQEYLQGDLRPRRLLAAAGRRGARRADGAVGRGRLLPRSRRKTHQGARPRQRPRHQPRQRHDGRLRDGHREDAARPARVDMDDLRRQLDDQIAVFMITNPNTVGIFEPKMREIADAVHAARRPGLPRRREHERDPRHRPARRFRRRHAALQSAQDLQRPPRRRRPGRGPICVTEKLAPYLPTPVVVKVRVRVRVKPN